MSIWSPSAQILNSVSNFPANIRLMEQGYPQNNELPKEGKSGRKSLFSWGEKNYQWVCILSSGKIKKG